MGGRLGGRRGYLAAIALWFASEIAAVRRQHSLDRTGGLNKGGFLAHRNVHRSEDETAGRGQRSASRGHGAQGGGCRSDPGKPCSQKKRDGGWGGRRMRYPAAEKKRGKYTVKPARPRQCSASRSRCGWSRATAQ